MTKDELIVEAEVLNEALMEAEELTNVLSLRLAYLTKRNSLLTERLPPLAISERLGHEDIQTTLKTYSHLYPNKQSEIARILAGNIFPKSGE